jgi:hypothetical protein
MNRCVTVSAAAWSALLLGAALPAGAAAPQSSAAIRAKMPHNSPEPTDAQLPPVDPAWSHNGWHAVAPHGYVLRRLAAARTRPEASAPTAFWLQGGVRVPILEQRARWWRVGWTHARTGWMPADELQPHASFILIDVATGRVIRRLAAKGEKGPVADGRFLWSLSDRGITRTALAEPPAFWANPIRPDRNGSLPDESVWSPDHTLFYLPRTSEEAAPLLECRARTGNVRQANCPAGLDPLDIDARGRVLFVGAHQLWRRDPAASRPSQRVPCDTLLATAASGSIYAAIDRTLERGTMTTELVRYDADLRPRARVLVPAQVASGCLTADGQTLGICWGSAAVELRRADTLAPIVTLHPNSDDSGQFVSAIAGNSSGWWTLGDDEAGNGSTVSHYTRQGRRLHAWEADGPGIMAPHGRQIYVAQASAILAIDTARGTVRKIPYRWRLPLPARYLPAPSDQGTPTRLEISKLSLTPDGHTLILTEWLNGDPEG